MFAQLPPCGSQRCHHVLKSVGWFVQVPREPVSDAPSVAEPEIVGDETLLGAAVVAAEMVPLPTPRSAAPNATGVRYRAIFMALLFPRSVSSRYELRRRL